VSHPNMAAIQKPKHRLPLIFNRYDLGSVGEVRAARSDGDRRLAAGREITENSLGRRDALFHLASPVEVRGQDRFGQAYVAIAF